MNIRLSAMWAAALLLAGLATSAEVQAQACLVRGAVAGDAVRLEMGMDTFWLQGMTLTVQRFDEFVEPSTYGGYICGVATVLLPAALVPSGREARASIYVGTYLQSGTRLRLAEFDADDTVPHCIPGEEMATCWGNGFYFRTAEVLNRR